MAPDAELDRCVCSHVRAHHARRHVAHECEWDGCGCPRFVLATTLFDSWTPGCYEGTRTVYVSEPAGP